MNLKEKIARAAEPLLGPGEIIEVSTVCTFGNVSMGKTELTAVLLLAVATGGALTYFSMPKLVHIALTNTRLLVLAQDFAGNPKSALTMDLPRAHMRAAPAKSSLTWLAYELTDKTGTRFARMSFGVGARRAGRQIAIALGAPVA